MYKLARPSVSDSRKRTYAVGLGGPDGNGSLALACNDAETRPLSIEDWLRQPGGLLKRVMDRLGPYI